MPSRQRTARPSRSFQCRVNASALALPCSPKETAASNKPSRRAVKYASAYAESNSLATAFFTPLNQSNRSRGSSGASSRFKITKARLLLFGGAPLVEYVAERDETMLAPNDPRHGTENGYQNHGCRCPECGLAHRLYNRIKRQERFARGLDPGDPRHGTDNGYTNYGCRCPECVQARAIWYAMRKTKREVAQ